MPPIKPTRIFGLVTVLLVQCPPTIWTQPAAEPTPLFTQAQASSGNMEYDTYCPSCHGANLEGIHLAPSLTGNRFDRTWRGKALDIFSFHLRRMPPESVAKPGILSEETHTNILAYILQSNGFASGHIELPSELDALADITLPK